MTESQRVVIFSTILICIFLRNFALVKACGCGGGCSFATGRDCARCCASLVKRSETTRPADDNEKKIDYTLSRVLSEKWPRRNSAVHDSCGCDSGCFYVDTNSCKRCCEKAYAERKKQTTIYEPQRLAETREEQRRKTDNVEVLMELLKVADDEKSRP